MQKRLERLGRMDAEENLRVQRNLQVGCFVAILLTLALYGAYRALDWLGLLPHEEDSVITAQASWFVGESKTCTSYPLSSGAAGAEAGKPAGYAVGGVACDDGPARQSKITFYGRVEQPEYNYVEWKCTREEKGFTCYELFGGTVPPR
jgi:hypothetical protein